MRKTKPKKKPVLVGISPEAHEAMLKESMKSYPPKTLRGLINIKNNLPENV